MHEGGQALLLSEGVILLGFALICVLVFRRLGLGATLGYLVAGALVGPHVLGLVGDAQEKISLAELGITLLLFVVGLELNPSRLWRMKQDILGLGLLQVVACGLALTAIIALIAQFSVPAALALGLPLALSSTAQVLPMLQSAGRLRTPFGERAFAILLFQDLALIPMITIIAALSRNPADAHGPSGWLLALYTVAAIVGLIAAGRFLIRPLFRLIGNLGEREMFVVAALFTVGGSAAIMQMLGLSTALGAFVAGVMLADSPYRHELEADVEPFRSILLGLFFLAVGMMLDLGAIAERPLFVISMAIALIATKTAIIMAIGMAFRMAWRSALALGLLLSQGGEFGFVLFTQANHAMLIDPEAASLFGAIVTLSMATTPFLMGATRRFREAPTQQHETRDGPVDEGANAIVVGYGRFGQTVSQMLIANDIPVTLIDSDIEMIDIAGGFGAKVYFGDGTRIDLLRQAGASEAELIMFCLDGDQLSAEMIEGVHEAFPNAAIYVRAYDRRAVIRLRGAPVTRMVREVLESAVKMARLALDDLGVSLEDIDRAEDMYRARDKERLKIQIETGDMRAANDRIITRYEKPSQS
ncbi:putative glutathione-regulated potassium-efflux system protein [Caenibius tardaugens NBRC 16725]|uniref:Putative glutathione-regulated potassium-efflux system protein n=1 Tax=Caenibius tardaugens NBRC 16725 TaxID=1219035 RepID=U2YHN0_9SPHN|nr:cation:proton antiporter [Caenibius tardaugens]AZI37323.1 sodium:proton exchanger [Caenibius tardaugens NBRC 16725]GAD47422.1 putative glutathione-regulated potassium-efflux system protein [Caenibius tardaugens NBRC 16725]